MEIVIATTNDGKKKELLSFFDSIPNITWLSLADFDPIEEPEETGSTFEENALQKAKYYANALQKPVFGEDSGFILNEHPDMFGLNTKRQFDSKDDTDWLGQFLEFMEPADDRTATFYSALAFFDPANDSQKTVLGSTSGEIEEFPQTPLEKGIPVSAVFTPDGFDDVYSAMKNEQKNTISHRAKACMQMKEWLEENFREGR